MTAPNPMPAGWSCADMAGQAAERPPALVQEHLDAAGAPMLGAGSALPPPETCLITRFARFESAGEFLILRALAPGITLMDIQRTTPVDYIVDLDTITALRRT